MEGKGRHVFELWEENVPFAEGEGSEDRPSIVPYIIRNSKRSIIICPGGGYGHRAEHEGEPIAEWLNSLGISAFVLNYRVAPYRHPCQLLDAQRAVRFVRYYAEGWQIDKQNIGVLGFSAGGHLAASVGTQYDFGNLEAGDPIERQSSRPDLMILCYPVISMENPYVHQGSKENLLGNNPDKVTSQSLSNEFQVSGDTPPTFIWHTANDSTVKVENSLLFAQALTQYNIPYSLHIYENGVHGLGLARNHPDVSNWTRLCEHWLKRYGV